jgi:alcohol dehydrogenase (cytochrome c)
MKWTSALPAIAALCFASAGFGQDQPTKNPREGDPQAIRNGTALYRIRCSGCHGMDATGLRGPDLTVVMSSGITDDQLFQYVKRGVPGTEMAPTNAPDDEIWQTLAYLRTLSVPAASQAVAGDAEHGERLFQATCIGCHRVNGRGGRIGPDLSRIGSARSRAALTKEIRTASAFIQPGYDAVTLVTRDGRRIRGIRKNEDAFSIQIMDTNERLQGHMKSELREIVEEKGSLMPDYGVDKLPTNDFTDLLAFLSRQRATVGAVAAAAPPQNSAPRVTSDALLAGLKDSSRWLMYGGDYGSQRHSPLTQITPENVQRLVPQWSFQTETLGRFEATPLLVDGVLYVTGPNNNAWALDARTGRQIWRYRRELPPTGLTYCCGPVNRGFGVLDDRLFMVTLDAHLLALDMKTGAVAWDVVLEDYKIGYAATLAPLVVKDKVIVGVAGAEFGIRGFIDAYDAATGKKAWRFWTVPAPGEPDYYGDDREGDNLYTDSLVAIDAGSGKLAWHYQFTPGDVHDWDATQVPVLGEVTIAGQRRKVVMFANRNGFFYTIDRLTGKVLVAKPFVQTTWAKEIMANGRPLLLPNNRPDERGATTCPDIPGGTNFMPPSFDPESGLFFVTAREACATYYNWKPDYKPGERYTGGGMQRGDNRPYGALRAIDPATGERKWEFRFPTPSMAGVTSTASGVVFSGDNEGNFLAFDARTGRNLWRYQTGASIWGAAAMTYMLDGRQFVVIPSGGTLMAFALSDGSRTPSQ